MIARLLFVGAILVPLAASPRFSDFSVPKSLVIGLVALAALGPWLFAHRHRVIAARRLLTAGLASFGLLSIANVFGQGLADRSPMDGARDLALSGLGLFVLASSSQLKKRSDEEQGFDGRRLLCLAGAFSPLLLLLMQALFEWGWNPLGVPHQEGRFTSTIGNSGLAAEVAVIALCFAGLLACENRGALGTKVLVGLSIASSLFVIYFSESRAAMVAAVAIGGWLLLSRRWVRAADETASGHRSFSGRRSTVALAGAGALLLVVASIATFLAAERLPTAPWKRLQSIASLSEGSNKVRVELAKDAVAMGSDHLAFGVGGGSFGAEHGFYRSASEWRLSGLQSHVEAPHCEPLRLFAEYGLLGVIAGLLFLFFLLRHLAAQLKADEPAHRQGARMALAVVIGFGTLSLFWFSFQTPATVYLTAAALGLGLAPRDSQVRFAWDRGLRWSLAAVALACAWIVVSVAWFDLEIVERRDRIEDAKQEIHRRLLEGQALPSAAMRRLGDEATEALPRLKDWRLSVPLRHRMLLALENVAGERRRLETAVRGLTGTAQENRRQAQAIGLAARALPRAPAVRAALEDAVRRAPGFIGTVRLLAQAEFSANLRPEAIDRLEKLLERNPDVPLLRPLLALPQRDPKAQLYHSAASLYREEVSRYPHAPESDLSWKGLAECLGASGDLLGACETVSEWNLALGDEDRRWAVAGAVSLHFGETPSSLGRFRVREVSKDAQLEQSYLAEATTGADPDARRVQLLALLGREPENLAALENLQHALARLARDASPQLQETYEAERNRAIARAKVHYAWDHLQRGDERLLRISLKQARRLNPRQGDAYLIELMALTSREEWNRAVPVLEDWKAQGWSDTAILEGFPELGPLLARPHVDEWIRAQG